MHNTKGNSCTAKKGAALFEAVEVLAATLFVRPTLQYVGREGTQ